MSLFISPTQYCIVCKRKLRRKKNYLAIYKHIFRPIWDLFFYGLYIIFIHILWYQSVSFNPREMLHKKQLLNVLLLWYYLNLINFVVKHGDFLGKQWAKPLTKPSHRVNTLFFFIVFKYHSAVMLFISLYCHHSSVIIVFCSNVISYGWTLWNKVNAVCSMCFSGNN